MAYIKGKLSGKELSDCIEFLNEYLYENTGIMAYDSLMKLKEILEK